MPNTPKYLLFTESLKHAPGGRLWRFLLVKLGGEAVADGSVSQSTTLSGSELVGNTTAVRAELLALVRGLEAIDGPGEVKLFSGNQYIRRGVSRGLAQWKLQAWHWERFGRRVPIRHIDLWQRIDHALQFHTVECEVWGDTALSRTLVHDTAPELEPSLAREENYDIEKPREPAVVVSPPRRRRRTLKRSIDGWTEKVGSMLEPAMAAG